MASDSDEEEEEEPGIAEEPDNAEEEPNKRQRVGDRTWESIKLGDGRPTVPQHDFKMADKVGATTNFPADATPLDFYRLFITTEMMRNLATSTNAYAKARRNDCREVDETDTLALDLFLALHIHLGLYNAARFEPCFGDSSTLSGSSAMPGSSSSSQIAIQTQRVKR